MKRAEREGKTIGRSKINGMTVSKVKRLRGEGLSIRDIAKETGVSVGKVSNIVQKGDVL